MKLQDDPIIVVLGPTSSGKSALAIKIAKKIGGEVISADSRQVYKGMDIGTGKITRREMKGVCHYLLDVVSPKKIFTVAKYKSLGSKAIQKILSRGKIPIICGGTGLYIRALVDQPHIPEVPPNKRLRARLVKKSVNELFEMLKNKDPRRAATIDSKNPRRLIRALEIIEAVGRVPELKYSPLINVVFIGINIEPKKLKNLIRARLKKRIGAGMIKEIEKLHNSGISWSRLYDLGLEYRYGALYLQNKITKKEFENQLLKESLKYAKRQMTWFKKDKRIHWIKSEKEAFVLLKNTLE